MENDRIETVESWLAQSAPELVSADEAWRTGNAGRARVASRRAAGMGLKAWLMACPQPGYGTSFMHHLNALADDTARPAEVREAAWRLAARPVPDGGFQVALPAHLTPMADARLVLDFARAELSRAAAH